MNANQLAAFQANAGFTPSAVAGVLLGAVFATLLLWGVWACAQPMSAGRNSGFPSVSSSALR